MQDLELEKLNKELTASLEHLGTIQSTYSKLKECRKLGKLVNITDEDLRATRWALKRNGYLVESLDLLSLSTESGQLRYSEIDLAIEGLGDALTKMWNKIKELFKKFFDWLLRRNKEGEKPKKITNIDEIKIQVDAIQDNYAKAEAGRLQEAEEIKEALERSRKETLGKLKELMRQKKLDPNNIYGHLVLKNSKCLSDTNDVISEITDIGELLSPREISHIAAAATHCVSTSLTDLAGSHALDVIKDYLSHPEYLDKFFDSFNYLSKNHPDVSIDKPLNLSTTYSIEFKPITVGGKKVYIQALKVDPVSVNIDIKLSLNELMKVIPAFAEAHDNVCVFYSKAEITIEKEIKKLQSEVDKIINEEKTKASKLNDNNEEMQLCKKRLNLLQEVQKYIIAVSKEAVKIKELYIGGTAKELEALMNYKK